MRERSLYPKVSKLFYRDYYVFFEYKPPDNSKREIDILCLDKRRNNSELLAVEVKISNWKKVVSQAFTRLFYVDRCYIAVPENMVSKIDIDMLKRDGIGVISVDGYAKVVMDAKKSKRTFEWRKKMIIEDLSRKIQYECS